MTAPNLLLNDGVYPVAPTPMLEHGAIDFNGFNACLNVYLKANVTGITVLGSGGELPYLSDAEQHEIAIKAASYVGSKKPLIVGVNAFSEHQAIRKIEKIQDHAQVAMLLIQRYYDLSFKDLKNTIANIAKHSPLPILYYHFPQVSGLWLSPEQIIEIVRIDNIVGIKDSSLNNHSAKKIIASGACSNYFTALSLFLPRLRCAGVTKAICPLAAIAPDIAQKVFEDSAHSTDAENSDAFTRLVELLPIASNPEKQGKSLWALLNLVSRLPLPLLKKASSPHVASKEALKLLGIPISNVARSPSSPLSNSSSLAIRAALIRSGLPIE